MRRQGDVATPWLRVAFSWPRLALIAMAGVATRIVTDICFSALSVQRGWSGIATLIVMYGVAFGVPIHTHQTTASLIAVVLGSDAGSDTGPAPRSTRFAVATIAVVAAVPIVIALVTMPGSGRVIDTTSGIVVGAVVLVLQLTLIVWLLRKRLRR